jgi:hypothetical protein
MKSLDIVSLALHDTNYDTTMAIQNIFEGKYDVQVCRVNRFFYLNK